MSTSASAESPFAGTYRLDLNPQALRRFALGSSLTIASLLCIPDGLAILPTSPDPIVWSLRMLGLWLTAYVLWSFGFLILLHIMRFVGGSILVRPDGIKLWRFGRLIEWGSIKALAVEPQLYFSRAFWLKPVAAKLTVYERKPHKESFRLIPHNIPSFQFTPAEFFSLFAFICHRSFVLCPDAAHVLISDLEYVPSLRKAYERSAKMKVLISAIITISLLAFLGRRAAVNYSFNSGNREFRQERYKAAEQHYRFATTVDPTFAMAWDRLARSEYRQSKTAAAEKHWHKALAMKPDLVESKIGLSNIHMLRREFGPARRLLTQAVRLDPRNLAACINLADLNLRLGNFDEAIRLCELVLKQDPNNANAHCLMARGKLRLGKLKEAEELFTHALVSTRSVQSSSFCKLVKAEIDLAAGRTKEASRAMHLLMAVSPHSQELLIDLIELALSQGNETEARTLVAEAKEHKPNDPWPFIYQAELELKSDNKDRARLEVDEAFQKPDQDMRSLKSCARLFNLLGDYNQEKRALDQCGKLSGE